MLRFEVMERSLQNNRFPGGRGQQAQRFRQDHRALEGLIHPSPFFPHHVMEQFPLSG